MLTYLLSMILTYQVSVTVQRCTARSWLFYNWTRRLVEHVLSKLLPFHDTKPKKSKCAKHAHTHYSTEYTPLQNPFVGLPHTVPFFVFCFLHVSIARGRPAASVRACVTCTLKNQVRFYKHLDTIKRRKLMGPQRINALAECTGGRPILIG